MLLRLCKKALRGLKRLLVGEGKKGFHLLAEIEKKIKGGDYEKL